MDVQLDQINLVVRDMEATAAFYERLGLTVRTTPDEWAAHHRNTGVVDAHDRGTDKRDGIDLDLDSERFASVWNEGWPGGPGVVLGFRVPSREDVDRLYEELTAAGHGSQQPPYDAFWGARYAVVCDPDGNSVGLMSPAEAARRTPPPAPPG